MVCIFYLVVCCVWHSLLASWHLDKKVLITIDKIVLCLFATIFISIHIVLCYLIFMSLNKLKKLEKSEANFISYDNDNYDSDDDYIYKHNAGTNKSNSKQRGQEAQGNAVAAINNNDDV